MKKPWSEVVTPNTFRFIDCLVKVAKAAHVYVNHDSPQGSILLPLSVKKSELVRALVELDKEIS